MSKINITEAQKAALYDHTVEVLRQEGMELVKCNYRGCNKYDILNYKKGGKYKRFHTCDRCGLGTCTDHATIQIPYRDCICHMCE